MRDSKSSFSSPLLISVISRSTLGWSKCSMKLGTKLKKTTHLLYKHISSNKTNQQGLSPATVWDCRMWLLLMGDGGKADVLNAVLLRSSLTGLLLVSNRTNAGNKLVSSLTKEKGFRECLGKIEVFKLAEPVEHHPQTFNNLVRSQRC